MKRLLVSVFFVIPFCIATAATFFVLGAAVGTYLVYSRNLPPIPEMKDYQPRTVSIFYADDGAVIGVFYNQKRFPVDLDQIPPHVVKAFLAAEDARFYEHAGIDWSGILRAAVRNIKAGKASQGGSTITMQVTRNFLLTREKRFSRKIRELILASRLEKEWGKQKILHIYLNEIYLGEGAYGVEAAARNYFDKPVVHLSTSEAALIAGLVASPVRYNPFKSVDLAFKRQSLVLGNMLRFGFITQEEFDKAKKEKLEFRKELPKPFELAPDFTEAVRLQVVQKYGADVLYNQGLKVFTTCRVDAQHKAVESVQKGVEEIKGRHKHIAVIGTVAPENILDVLKRRPTPQLTEGRLCQGVVTNVVRKKDHTLVQLAFSKGVKGNVKLDEAQPPYRIGHVLAVRFDRFIDDVPYFTVDDRPELQAALVLIENNTGYVRALVGGASKEQFKFNRALQAKRQPGSAFKPVIYSAAVERMSYSPSTIIVDEPIVVEVEAQDEEWQPKNSAADFLGPISFRRALELSRNICTVKILMDMGFDPVEEIAAKMGITSPLRRNLALSLGTSEVTLFELTSAYTTFPNGGVHIEPVLIKQVLDRFGNVLEDNTKIPILDEDQVPRPVQREELSALEGAKAKLRAAAGKQAESKSKQATEPREQSKPAAGGSDAGDNKPEFDDQEQGGAVKVQPRKAVAALSPQTAYIMTALLQGGVRAGTGAALSKYVKRRDLAGKTGTTNNAEDAWFIGYTNDYTAGVWVGFDEKRPLGNREEGGRAALPIWGYFMKSILDNKAGSDFAVPPDISFVEMLTYQENRVGGNSPTLVREPVYTPLAGKTLVLSPLDPPELLRLPGGVGPLSPGIQHAPPATVVPLRPGDANAAPSRTGQPGPGRALQQPVSPSPPAKAGKNASGKPARGGVSGVAGAAPSNAGPAPAQPPAASRLVPAGYPAPNAGADGSQGTRQR